jgi:hypothetical protein
MRVDAAMQPRFSHSNPTLSPLISPFQSINTPFKSLQDKSKPLKRFRRLNWATRYTQLKQGENERKRPSGNPAFRRFHT